MPKTAGNHKQFCCEIFISALQGYNFTAQVI